jgi:hypothetical protein
MHTRMDVNVVGMRAGGREHVVAHVSPGDPVLVVPEPDNPYDPHALAVYTCPVGSLLRPDRLLSSATDPQRLGRVDDDDRLLLMDRQAGYVPRDVAATLRLPEQGIVGLVSRVRHPPPLYTAAGEPVEQPPVGFDVRADWPDPTLDLP